MPLERPPMTIGWYMSEKKASKLNFAGFMEYANKFGCTFKNLADDDSNSAKYDVIITKLADSQNASNIRCIINSNPQAVVIDPIPAQEQIMDRWFMHKVLNTLRDSVMELNIGCPKGMVIYGQEDVESVSQDLKFPCMIKNLQASGGYSLHLMAVVWRTKDLGCISFPAYIQEYINHNGTIFKVYVIGQEISVVSRISLPNFTQEYRDPIIFNSQQWKHELPPEYVFDYSKNFPPPDQRPLRIIAKKISLMTGLTLFGYDLIVDTETNNLIVIDINFFPDYSGVSDVFEKLYNYISERYEERNGSL